MGALKEQIERLREALKAWRKWQPAQPLTEQEHIKRIEDAKAVAEMMATPGWRVYTDRARTVLDKKRDSLIELTPSVFRSARGLQAKGEVIGGKDVLNMVAQVIADGMASEATLEKWAKEAKEDEARLFRKKQPKVL